MDVTEVHRQWPKPVRREFLTALSRGVAPCVWSLDTHHHSSSRVTGKEQWEHFASISSALASLACTGLAGLIEHREGRVNVCLKLKLTAAIIHLPVKEDALAHGHSAPLIFRGTGQNTTRTFTSGTKHKLQHKHFAGTLENLMDGGAW